MHVMTALRSSPFLSRSMATIASSKGLNALALSKAEEISRSWKGTNATGGRTKYPSALFIRFHFSKPLFQGIL